MRMPLAVACFLLSVSPAFAGNVVLTAADNFCEVEIREGNFVNADDNPVTRTGGMSAGQTYVGQEGTMVCYRRTNQYMNCASGLQVNASCFSKPSSGTANEQIR